MVDPLFSSAHTKIVHDGAATTRVEKTERIAKVPEAIKMLRVCVASRGASNCSRCSKCLRTMVTIDLLEVRQLADSFDWANYSVDRVGDVYLANKNDIDFFLEIRQAALERARHDIVRAVDRSLERSKRSRVIDRIVTKLGKTPVLWRCEVPLRRTLLET